MVKVKDKERLQKGTREKPVMYKGNPTRLLADFSAETFQAQKKRHDSFKVLKGKSSNQDYHLDLKERLRAFQISKS